eukprot:6190544-Alexandrium_andersonii.AAC.1
MWSGPCRCPIAHNLEIDVGPTCGPEDQLQKRGQQLHGNRPAVEFVETSLPAVAHAPPDAEAQRRPARHAAVRQR